MANLFSGSGGTDPLAAHYLAVANRVKLLTNTSPLYQGNLDLAMGIAQDGTLSNQQMVDHSAQLAGQVNLDETRRKLLTLGPATQRSIVATMTPSQQGALEALGYTAPVRDESHNDLFHEIAGIGGGAVGRITHAVAAPIMAAVHPVLQGAAALGNIPGTAYRGIRQMDSVAQWTAAFAAVAAIGAVVAAPFTGGTSLLGLGGLSSTLAGLEGFGLASAAGTAGLAAGTVGALLTNPSDWWDATSSSWDGERVFSRDAQRQARSLLKDNPYVINLAKDVAFAGGIDEIATDFAQVRDATSSGVIGNSIGRVAAKIADPTSPEYARVTGVLSRIATDAGFREAVGILHNGKISFGRDLAHSVGLHAGDALYSTVSGGADGLFLITTDPIMMAQNFAELRSISRYAMPTSLSEEEGYAWLKNLSDNRAPTRRAHEMLAEAVDTGRFGVVKRTMPESQSLWFDLTQHRDELRRGGLAVGGYDREHMLKFFEEADGMQKLLAGSSTVHGTADRLILAHTSIPGMYWGRAKSWGKAVIDLADSAASDAQMRRTVEGTGILNRNKALGKATVDEEALRLGGQTAARPEVVTAQMGLPFTPTPTPRIIDDYTRTAVVMAHLDNVPVINRVIRHAGELFGSLTSMIPEHGYVELAGPGAAASIDKFIDLGRVMGMSADTREAWRSFAMNQPNTALRQVALDSYLNTMLRVAGADVVPEGRAMAAEFLERTRQAYSLAGSGEQLVGGQIQRIGVLPMADQAYQMAIPNLAELRRAVQTQTVLKYVLDVGDIRRIDTAMTKIWKPAVLLRIGFIPRAAGEELLAWLAREGPSAYARGFAERAVAQGKMAGPGGQAFVAGLPGAHGVPANFDKLVEHYNVFAHLRPLERMVADRPAAAPFKRLLEGYTNWLRRVLEDGVMPASIEGKISPAYRSTLLGKDRSLRRMLLSGIDPTSLEAAGLFESRFGDSLARFVSAKNAGILDMGQRHNLLEILTKDPKTGNVIPMKYTEMTSQMSFYSRGDTGFDNALVWNLNHTFGDPVIANAYGAVLPRMLPEGLSPEQAGRWAAQWSQIGEQSIVHPLMRLGLSGKELNPQAIQWWLDKVTPYMEPNLALKLMTEVPMNATSVDEIFDVLARPRPVVEAPAAVTVRPGDIGGVQVRPGPEPPPGGRPSGTGDIPPTTEWNTGTEGQVVSQEDINYLFGTGAMPSTVTPEIEAEIKANAAKVRATKQHHDDIWKWRQRGGPDPRTEAEKAIDAANVMRGVGQTGTANPIGEVGTPTGPAMETSAREVAAPVAPESPLSDQATEWYHAHPDETRSVSDLVASGVLTDEIVRAAPTVRRRAIDFGDKMLEADVHRVRQLLAEVHADPIHNAWAQIGLPHQIRGTLAPGENYFLTAAEGQAAIEEHIRRGQLALDGQEGLRRSKHGIADRYGVPVARPLADGAQRSYVPALHPTNAARLNRAILNNQAVIDAVHNGRGVEQSISAALLDSYNHLPVLQVRSAAGRAEAKEFFDRFTKSHFGVNSSNLDEYVGFARRANQDQVLLAGGGQLADPRVATDVSNALQRMISPTPVTNNGSGVAFVDLARGTNPGKVFHEPLMVNARAEMVPVNPTWHDIQGKLIHGTSLEESAASHAPVIRERVDQVAKEETRAVYQSAQGSPPLLERTRTRGGRVVDTPVEDGTVLRPSKSYVDGAGDPVRWGDPQWWKPGEVTNGDGYLWELVAPALRDELDGFTGQAIRYADGTRHLHFDVHDIGSVTGRTPFQTFGPTYMMVPPESTWDGVVRKGFDNMISPAIDAIARRPMAYHNFVEAYRDTKQAFNWLLDRRLFTERFPEMFGKELGTLMSSARDRAQIAQTARGLTGYFDHDLSRLTDNEVIVYIDSLGAKGIAQAEKRVVARAGERGTTRLLAAEAKARTELAQLRKIAEFNPKSLPLAVDGIDAPVAAAKAMISDFEGVLHLSWRRAQTTNVVQEILKGQPGLRTKFDNGGWELLQAARDNLDHATAHVSELAALRTLKDTIPFLDSHEFKSQFAEYGRQLMPFWYAEENFMKRWAKTLKIAPEAIRKGQLTYMGMRNVGIVRTDGNGKDWMIIPGSGPLIETMGKVPGLNLLPVGAVFQTPTASLLPGFGNNLGVPSYSPLVTLPVAAVTHFFPELHPLDQALAGGQGGADRGVMRQFVPTQLMNFWEAVTGDEHTSARYASAMTTAAAMMDANGKGLADNATSVQLQDYLDDLRSHARTILIAQAITGFISPGAPSQLNTGDNSVWGRINTTNATDPARLLHEEYLNLIRYQGIDQGTQTFIANHDHAGPQFLANPMAYTLGATVSTSGAPLPATHQAVAFYQDNQAWMHEFPEAGPWLLPPDQSGDGSAVSQDAYTSQTQLELRYRRSPEEFLKALKFKSGAAEYFRAKDAYDADVAHATATHNSRLKDRADLAWTGFQANYLATHPVFADELTSGNGRARRQRTIAQLRLAVDDPNSPRPWHFDQLKQMLDIFDHYKIRLGVLSESRTKKNQAATKRLKTLFSTSMEQMVLDHPELESMWTSLLKPEASLL